MYIFASVNGVRLSDTATTLSIASLVVYRRLLIAQPKRIFALRVIRWSQDTMEAD